MKLQFKKTTAVAMAMTMCVSGVAMAADPTPTPAPINGETAGTFNTSFDVYSPALHISVPLKADIEVNPMANASATGVKQFTVASNSIDVINASVDKDAGVGIPINVTVKAAITRVGDDVVAEYNTFIADKTSTKKRINLNLTATDETKAAKLTGTTKAMTGDSAHLLDLSSVSIDPANQANYTGATNTTPITKYGSLLSVDIDEPSSSDATWADGSKITATVGSFAVTGAANTNADWKADDVAVSITYNVKAVKDLGVTTPKIATAPTFTAGTSAADVTIEIPNVGEATVLAMAVHNDGEGLYKDFMFESDAYTVAYATTGSGASATTKATITIPKEDGVLAFLTGADYSGKPQDLIIALSDGRFVVSTLKCTAATTP